MSLYLGIDQGTHASRAILFDETGRAIATGVSDVRLHRPRPGWAEHDETLVESVFEAIGAALRIAGRPEDNSFSLCSILSASPEQWITCAELQRRARLTVNPD